MYGRAAHERLTDSGDWREDIDLQQHRYMVEDTRLGLSLMVSVGRWAGIQMPVTEGLLNIACPVAEQDLYETGRTLEALGLSHMTREQLNTLLHQGFTSPPAAEEKAPIGIIGAGRMGRGIALAYAFAGVPVLLVDAKDRDDGDRQRLFSEADEELRRDLAFLAQVELLSSAQIPRVMERVTYLSMAQGATELARCDIVYEAVPERMDAKERAFKYASEAARDDAVVASTTSTFLVSDLAKRLNHPQRCINAHWLNPAHLIPLVELSCEASVDDRALALLQESLHTIGKVTVVCSASPGYIVPRIQSLALNEAARLVADGVASAEDIDKAVRNGFGPRYAVLGLLEFIDWGGGDILYYASNYLADNLDPRYGPPDIVAENMRTGRNGVREGQGFFDYRDMDTAAYREARMTEFVQLLGHRGLLPRFMSANTGTAGIASE
jgi:3-hydroxybutyryl-CoA dehydrogenase